ncbi:DUF4399 domain-containing protein [Bosea sp. (in: a-proteobacteria)]|uniref:DUF4399 domain-containing protein n=1 Tax=Bosea sp. (in: a-proteobacteria) TaxID=1871050 RepID=UPI002FC5AEFF
MMAQNAFAQERPRPRSPAPAGAKVSFVELGDNARVPGKLLVRFAVTGMEIAPANTQRRNAGHHHLLIDTGLPPLGQPIPSDFNHLHFGGGQSEAEILLSPGRHTLQLLFADHDHVPHDPPVMSQKITVEVEAAPEEKPRTVAAPNARVFFVGLQDGATIPARSVIRFATENIAIVPAGTKQDNAGHHHLLVDTELPPLDREIPSDFNHLHFGRGQTETELTLPPGEHTLQLLFADHEHVPHDPPVMSQKVKVRVAAATAAPPVPTQQASARTPGRTPAPNDAAVYFVYPRNGTTIYATSTIRFGLRNMGVAPAGVTKPNTGHHHLLIDVPTPALDVAIPSDLNHLHFGNGQTERKITLPPGRHTLQLILGDDQHVPHDPPIMSERIEILVGNPKKRRARR